MSSPTYHGDSLGTQPTVSRWRGEPGSTSLGPAPLGVQSDGNHSLGGIGTIFDHTIADKPKEDKEEDDASVNSVFPSRSVVSAGTSRLINASKAVLNRTHKKFQADPSKFSSAASTYLSGLPRFRDEEEKPSFDFEDDDFLDSFADEDSDPRAEALVNLDKDPHYVEEKKRVGKLAQSRKDLKNGIKLVDDGIEGFKLAQSLAEDDKKVMVSKLDAVDHSMTMAVATIKKKEEKKRIGAWKNKHPEKNRPWAGTTSKETIRTQLGLTSEEAWKKNSSEKRVRRMMYAMKGMGYAHNVYMTPGFLDSFTRRALPDKRCGARETAEAFVGRFKAELGYSGPPTPPTPTASNVVSAPVQAQLDELRRQMAAKDAEMAAKDAEIRKLKRKVPTEGDADEAGNDGDGQDANKRARTAAETSAP